MAWEQLLTIYKEAAQIAEDERNQRPRACPNDGEPLREDAEGKLRCSYDGWTEGDT